MSNSAEVAINPQKNKYYHLSHNHVLIRETVKQNEKFSLKKNVMRQRLMSLSSSVRVPSVPHWSGALMLSAMVF